MTCINIRVFMHRYFGPTLYFLEHAKTCRLQDIMHNLLLSMLNDMLHDKFYTTKLIKNVTKNTCHVERKCYTNKYLP